MVLLLHFPEAAAKWLHREDLQGDKGCSLCPEDHAILWEGEEGEKRGLDKGLVFMNKASFQKLNPAVWKDIRGHQAILTLELSLLMKNFLVLFEHFLCTLTVQVFQYLAGENCIDESISDMVFLEPSSAVTRIGWWSCFKSGVTARVGRGTSSQATEILIS